MKAQTADPAVLAQGTHPAGLRSRLARFISVTGAVLLALTPFGAVLVLGWLMRVMRRETVIALARHGHGERRRQGAVHRLARTPELADFARFPGFMRCLRG